MNSYSRFVSDAHAPTSATWGWENRTVAIRIPGGNTRSTRIEHRVDGGDANPYLLFAAIFGSALHGMKTNLHPPKPTKGNAYEKPNLASVLLKSLPEAINGISHPLIETLFAKSLLQNLVATKTQEFKLFSQMSDHDVLQALIDTA